MLLTVAFIPEKLGSFISIFYIFPGILLLISGILVFRIKKD